MGEQFEEILEQLDVNIYMTDINTHRILFMNQKMKKEYGVENPEGQLCWQVLQEGAKGVCKVCKIPELMRLGKENQVICWRENNSKVKRTFENFDSLVRWGGRLVHMQQSYDITNILQLSESASKDSLCGVWNREKGKSMLAECAENLEEGHSWLVALLDVDNLKTVNDTYGHQEGDFLLQRLCQVIQGQLQKTDFMFRLSGDEFVVVMKDVPEKEGVKRFRAWRELVEQEGARTQRPYQISYSFGVCLIREKGAGNINDYLALADEEMYGAKLRRRKTAQVGHGADAPRLNSYAGAGNVVRIDYPSDLLYDALIQSTDDYVYFCNMKTGVFRYSPAQVAEFELPGQVVENPLPYWEKMVHPEDWERFYRSNMEIGENQRDAHFVEFRARKRTGEYVWLRCRGRLIRDIYGEPSLFAGIMSPMGRHNKIDPLTQLLNQNEFYAEIQQGIDEDGVEQIGVMILDIDNFRLFNELHDRESGDELFRTIANLTQDSLPGNGLLFRLEGDRLGAVFGHVSKKELAEFYRGLQKRLEIVTRGRKQKLPVTVSAGSALYPEDGVSAEELFRCADYAVQHAKQAGKNQLAFFDNEIAKGKIRSLELSRKLREAISRGYEGFYLNFQPQVDTKNETIIGVEALMRWKAPDGQAVSPVEFIPVMEESGMIREATAWMLETALKEGNAWRKLKPDFSVSVNISAPQLMDKNFLHELASALSRSGFPSKNLIVELTESCAVQNLDIFQERFEELRKRGIRVAMDDFGTGYSSLGMLKNAPVDLVKIDREFVKNILVSSFDATFISFVVAICHNVGITVCLEGVETADEYEFLKPMQLDCIQGYYFGRPAPAAEITRLLCAEQASSAGC